MENRRVMPGLYKGYPESLKKKDKEERDHTDPMYKPEKAEGARMKADDQRKAAKEPKLERSYTIDEMTVATLLKGHPQAQEILDGLLKGKAKNESGEEFQDGSEDTIGGEGHAKVARPDSIKHEGKPSGIGPDEPGTGTKKASVEEGDLEKSYATKKNVQQMTSEEGKFKPFTGVTNPKTGYEKTYEYDKKKGEVEAVPEGKTKGKKIPANAAHEKELKNASQDDLDLEKAINIVGDFLMEKGHDIDETNEIIEEYFGLEKSDNLADNLPDEFEDEMEDDDTIPPEKNAKKSFTLDEQTLNHLLKTMGADRLEDAIKAVIGGAGSGGKDPGQVAARNAESGALSSSKKKLGSEEIKAMTSKITASAPKLKSEGSDNDLEKSEDDMGEEGYSMDFSKSILERMGLEKGATSVSKETGGGKATQINYGTKPTTRFKHPKAKSDKKYIHNPEKGTVKVEKEGEKTREIGAGEQAKLKNASMSSEDLYKSLDAILDKKRD